MRGAGALGARRAGGFTLAEVLVAMAITSLIGGLVWVSFSAGLKAREMVMAEADLYRELRTGMSRMTREISMAFISDKYDPARFKDNTDRPTFFTGEDDRLSFSMLGHQRLARDAKESDQSTVFYKVDADPDERGVRSLVRCEKAVFDDAPARCDRWETLLRDVKKVEFGYWDNKRNEWVRQWDTRRNEHPSQLPDRVLVTLTTKDELGKEQRYVTQARLNMLTVMPRY